MYLERYRYIITDNHLEYEFTSIGSKGEIRKRVTFTPMSPLWYNLGFGDVDSDSGVPLDDSISNNGDMKVVLATVAAIAHDFMCRNKGVIVFAMGVAAIRSRLYRMSINIHWFAISAEFEVFGWRNNHWENFSKEETYDAFFIQHRKM